MDLAYSYANARIKAMKSKLFDRERMRELMDVHSLTQFIELLEESPYKPAFVNASTKYSGIELVRHALDEDLVNTIERIAEFLPASAIPVYRAIVKRFKINNIKKIVACKGIGRPVGPTDLLPADAISQGILSKLNNAPDLTTVLSILHASSYSKVAKYASADYAKTKDFRVILTALDRYYYEELYETLQKAPDAFTKGFIQDQLDFANASLLLRMRRSGVSSEKIREMIVGIEHSHLAREMLAASTTQAAIETFARRKHLNAVALVETEKAKGLASLEVELEKALLRKARSTLSRGVLTLGVAVAFMHLKREEVHSLRKIAYATQFDVKDEIRQVVLSAG